jgi:DNA-binding LacI/PurR family transcriptional regulator
MAVTIRHVAHKAGVSAATVSRTFSRPEKVDPGTRAIVLRVAEDLGYHPNTAARSLSGGHTGFIALSVPDLNNPFFAAIAKGALSYAAIHELQVALIDFDDRQTKEEASLKQLLPQVDGAILCSSRLDEQQVLRMQDEKPIVLLNRKTQHIPYVHIDNSDGIRQALLHLRAFGHTRIGYAGGPKLSRSAEERLSTFTTLAVGDHAIRGERITTEGVILGEFPSTFAGGELAADEALNAGVSAVVAYNDVMAIGIMRRMLNYGVSVPNDISIVGCDDIPMASMANPGLTTIHLPQEETGSIATEMLTAVISGSSPGPVEIPTQLVVRASTGKHR